MEKTVKIRLFESVAGTDFAYGKGENEVPADRAAEFVRAGLGEYIGAGLGEYIGAAAKPSDLSEKATSKKAAKAEKR